MRIRLVLSFVGMIAIVLGLSMFVSIGVSLMYGERQVAGRIALCALICILSGALVFRPKTYVGRELGLKEGFGIVGFCWLLVPVLGSLPFLMTGAIPDFSKALFESTSGLTTTGSSILENIEILPKGVLFWRCFLQWLGGMGIIVLSIAILPFLGLGGMQLYKAESPGPTKNKLRPRIQQTAKMLWGVYLLITICCVSLLSLAGMSLFDATCHTFAAVATGGFANYNASIGHFTSPWIQYILIFFMIVSGMSFSLHYRALSSGPGAYIRNSEAKLFLTLILGATLAVYFSRWDTYLPMELKFRESLFQVVTIASTTGFATADYEQWKPITHFILLSLMIIGACAGSTGGGLKVMRLYVLVKHFKNAFMQQLHPNGVFVIKMDGYRVSREVTQNILGLFLVYSFMLALSVGLLTFFGLDLVTAFSGTVTCFGAVGPGLGSVGPAENFSSLPTPCLWILSFDMVLGRLEFFSLLILFMPRIWRR